MEFEIYPCKTREKYKVKPKKNAEIDFNKLKENFRVKIYTPVACIIETDAGDVIVQRFGELKFKTCTEKEKIKKISEKIFRTCNTS